MTLEQILSPAVMDWIQENDNLPKEQVIQEFDKWLVENEETINESVKNNIDEINECIKMGCEKSRILLESASDDDDDDFLNGISFDDEDVEPEDDEDDKPISGKSDDADTGDVVSKIESITGKVVLTSNIWEGDKSKSNNINDVINAVYDSLERRKISHKKNTALWSKFNVSKVKSMAALFAFTDLRDADLSSWDTSSVRNMEGMFYKSTFNNNSISGWDVNHCINFKRMFTYSKFKGNISKWDPGFVLKPEYDSDGKIIRGKKIKVQVDLPLIGANADEEDAMLSAYWDSVLDSLPLDENKENKNNKPMRYILDYNTFINEGFGEYVKKGINKIKSFFKNIAVKIDNLVAMFDKNGKIIEASSPYTALNYISNGEVKGVTAFTSVKNEFLNENVQSIASIVESPEYYGIIDEDSIEYRNYETMVSMINEHYAKYGEKLNEDRVGFRSESGGLTGVKDITTSSLKELIDVAIRTTPGELAKLDFGDEEEIPQSGAIMIFGSPGVGKTTIPKSIIKEWNKNNENNKKAIMVVECGDLTIDGFSLPIPTKKTLGEFLSEHPEVKRRASESGNLRDDADYMDTPIDVSIEALKTWLPAYKKGATEEETNLRNDICNGYIMTKMGKNGRIEQTETTEGGIILFDEFFRANEQIFKILMQIVLNRTFNNGEYELGNKWAIICCSNRPNDDKQVQNSIKNSPGATLGTRFGGGIYNFIPDFDEWKKWAIKHGHFDAVTLKFIMEEKDPNNGEYLNWHNIEKEGASKNKLGYATPRTWSMLMNELYIIMKVKNYSSIDEIPQSTIREKAEGLLGTEMADKYIKYLNIHKKNQISYDAILNNSKYMIPKDVESTCGGVIRELYNHISTTFDNENLPKDDQMVNMFNFIKNNYNPNGEVDGGPKDNFIRPLYATLFYKFGFFENKDGFLKLFPKFVTAVMKMYGIKSGNDLVKFINDAPTL